MNPLSGLYGVGIALRNALFDRGVLSTLRLERPVVSVGNVSTGGTGKTPFVLALGELLKQANISFDVLSRGYGRKTHGVRVVDPNGRPSEFGDEPLLIARRLGVPVIVGESRYEAGRVAEQRFRSQLHLLDDGFQHRALIRDFDIVLLGAGDLEDRLLPIGRLREPLSSLERAHAIVLPQEVVTAHPELREKGVWRMRREISLSGVPNFPVVFCGIARSEQFFRQVRAAGVAPAAEVAFRDHQNYDERDIGRLAAMRDTLSAGGFLTTEKDAVNLGSLRDRIEPLSVAELRVSIDRSSELVDTILTRIGGRKAHS